jgi:hypothetical protein
MVLRPVPVGRRCAKTQDVARRASARANHERSWVVKTVTAAESAQVLSTSEQAGTSGEPLAEQEERGEESFEATIVRLDGLSLERLFRQADER